MTPSLFIAHGSPMIAIESTDYAAFLEDFGAALPRPSAILVFSAHWLSGRQMVSGRHPHHPMYDFGGFPEALYRVRYAPPGDPTLAQAVQHRLQRQQIDVVVDEERDLDHGVWTILSRLFPDADVPVVSMSVHPRLPPQAQYEIGQALSEFREQGVLIVGSGVTVHNFQLLEATNSPVIQSQVLAFEDWLEAALHRWDLESLWNYRTLAPHADLAVPPNASEHFAPLFYAMGAADNHRVTETLYRDLQWNVMTQSVYRFG